MDKEKHLEFIQGVVNRLANCSFLVKGWTITLVAAIFGLAAKDANPKYILISYFIVPFFWLLMATFSVRSGSIEVFTIVSESGKASRATLT